MARTAIPVQSIPRDGGAAVLSDVAADAANGMSCPNDARTTIEVLNNNSTGGASVTVTVHSMPCSHGHLGDISLVVPPQGSGLVAPSDKELFQQADGTTWLDFSTGANIFVGAWSNQR